MTKHDFKALKRIPAYEVALQGGRIVQLPKNVDRKHVLFISHRWLRDSHPDDPQNTKLHGMQALVENVELTDVDFIRFDYFSIPQAPESFEQQLRAINSLPYYVRQCAEFVTLVGVSGIINEKGIDRASIIIYNSRGWCRLERLAAVSPALDVHTQRRLPAAKLWVYDMTNGSLNDSPFAFMDERFINPLEGSFRDGEAEKARISPMVIQLCSYIEKNSGMDVVRQRSAIIKQSAEKYMNEYNRSTLQPQYTSADTRINAQSSPRPAEMNSCCIVM